MPLISVKADQMNRLTRSFICLPPVLAQDSTILLAYHEPGLSKQDLIWISLVVTNRNPAVRHGCSYFLKVATCICRVAEDGMYGLLFCLSLMLVSWACTSKRKVVVVSSSPEVRQENIAMSILLAASGFLSWRLSNQLLFLCTITQL